MFIINSFKEVIGLLLFVVLLTGVGSAFQAIENQVIPKISYFVKLSGAGYNAENQAGENVLKVGAETRLKDKSLIEFTSIYYDCYPTSGEPGFVANFTVYDNDTNLQNKPNMALKSKAIANLKLGEKKTFWAKINNKFVPLYEFELIEFAVPQISKLTNLFLKEGTIIVTMCKDPKTNNGWIWSWKNITLKKYFETDISTLTKYKTINFIKPLNAYAILKVKELK